MRMQTKEGHWFDTEAAVRVTDKLWFTRRGTWIYQRLVEPCIIEEREAADLLLDGGQWFEDTPGFHKLPDEVQESLQRYLDDQYPPEDEV